MNRARNPSSDTIWLLEDDEVCREIMASALGDRWTVVELASIGELERLAAEGATASLLVADVCLPDRSLVSWLKSASAEALLARVPLLVVSGVDEVDVIRSAFAGGALDFVSKPFGKAELLVKVERALDAPPSSGVRRYTLDVPAMQVRAVTGETAALTAKEMQIAALLWNAPGLTLGREVLYAGLWRDCRVGPKTLDVHLSRLRQKLRPLGLEVKTCGPDEVALSVLPGTSAASDGLTRPLAPSAFRRRES